ncbi:MAG: guanine-specific ribonuclease [Gemmataceae bacterium]|nr:guanine-specific ribonuclease [Gemmataceae bacterium]
MTARRALRRFSLFACLTVALAVVSCAPPEKPGRSHEPDPEQVSKHEHQADIPEKVVKVLRYIDEHHRPPEGHEGGRIFRNAEERLPRTDAGGKPITYREWDVDPKVPGVNRGPERLVTGSDGSAYYTPDHYRTFRKIR